MRGKKIGRESYLRKALQTLYHSLMHTPQILRRILRDRREAVCEIIVRDCLEGLGKCHLVEVEEGGCAWARSLRYWCFGLRTWGFCLRRAWLWWCCVCGRHCGCDDVQLNVVFVVQRCVYFAFEVSRSRRRLAQGWKLLPKAHSLALPDILQATASLIFCLYLGA
jgi:hypothetical protein